MRLPTSEREEKKFDYFVLLRNPTSPDKAITGAYLIDASVNDQSFEKAVNFTFNSRGGQLFYELTTANLPARRIARLPVLLPGNRARQRSRLRPIAERRPSATAARFTWNSARPEDLRRLAQILRSGALPATLKSRSRSAKTRWAPRSGPTRSARGRCAVLGAFVAVLVFMLVYYRFAGLVACVALLANLLLTVAFMVLVNATFTLPGLAGLVLMLGMAVDANVLIYERLREERERGASLALAIRNGYDRAFPTIIDTHLTSIFTAIVLYVVGNDQLKGFGISLTVGLIISLFTSLYMTRLMFDLWLAKGWLQKLSMFQGLTNFLHRNYIDFMGIRYYWFTATIVLTVIGLAVFLVRGPAGLEHRLRRRHGLRRPAGQAGGHRDAPRQVARSEAAGERGWPSRTCKQTVRRRHAVHASPTPTGRRRRSRSATRSPATPSRSGSPTSRTGPRNCPTWSVEQTFVTTGDQAKAYRQRRADSSPSARPRRSPTWSRSWSIACWWTTRASRSRRRSRSTKFDVDKTPGDAALQRAGVARVFEVAAGPGVRGRGLRGHRRRSTWPGEGQTRRADIRRWCSTWPAPTWTRPS